MDEEKGEISLYGICFSFKAILTLVVNGEA